MRRRLAVPKLRLIRIPNPLQSEKKVTPRHTERFHRNKHRILDIIMSKTEDHEIIHGEQAVKKQTPNYLHRHTQDVDIFSPTPMVDALEVEKALDKKFKGDFFNVKLGIHPGTVRVVAHANKESYADYTKPDRDIPFTRIDKKNYASLNYIAGKSKEIIKDPFSNFRHAKDQDTLNRVKIVEKKRRRK